MRRAVTWVWMVPIALLAGEAVGHGLPAADGPEQTPAADQEKLKCVKWTTEARFVGFAYDHLVHLDNRCDHAAVCAVKTDVSPETETVDLAKGEKKSLLTFRGSPSREFKATVACKKKQGSDKGPH